MQMRGRLPRLINSPVVRAETLRFKDKGVFSVAKRVLLLWYHACLHTGDQLLGVHGVGSGCC
jgi:isoleucyl-tRNA synthetase